MALTKKDLDQISKLINDAGNINNARLSLLIDEKVREHHLVTKDDISHLPTKHEFYNKMDEVLGEVVKEREENLIQQSQLEDHSNRLDHIESQLSLGIA